jgi:hypothetical protein
MSRRLVDKRLLNSVQFLDNYIIQYQLYVKSFLTCSTSKGNKLYSDL